MSCANNDINTDLKDLTKKSLDYIYNYAYITTNNKSNLFEPTTDINDPFNINFKNNYSNNIQTDLNSDNDEGLNYLTINTEDNVFMNCAIQTSVPWFTSSENHKTCDIVNNIDYDENRISINKIKDKSVITPILVSKNKSKTAFCAYSSNINKAYCENRWYDWITIPDYYLGNTYYKDNSHYTELDVYKCYKPCPVDYLPYTKENGDIKCIPKKFFANGIFNKKYMYNSLGLINLIGNLACNTDKDKSTKQTNLLYILHRLLYEHNIETKIDNNIYSNNKELDTIIKGFDNIKNEYDNIYNDLLTAVNDNVLKNFDESSNKDYSIINEFTYAHYKFNENEPEMYSFTGMEANGLLSDPILIHTWMLAQIFQPLKTEIIFDKYNDANYGTTDDEKKTKYESIQNEFIYKKLFNVYNNEYNKAYPDSLETYKKSGNVFKVIEGEIKRGKNKSKNIAIRLKNIFFKAINNCYNNKTIFSVNLIARTKKALQNGMLLSIIKENNFYYFPNNINFHKKDINANEPISDISDNDRKKRYDLLLTLNNNIEYQFYKDTDIKILYEKYDIKKLENNPKKILSKYFDNDNNYCHYLFSVEELETPTCPIGQVYNTSIKECEPQKAVKKEEIKKDDEDDDGFKIPDLKNIFTIFIQILMVVLILYIFYIIHDIFGEIIKKVLNYIYVNFFQLFYNVNSMLLINDTDEYEREKNKLKQRINITEKELETIKSKKDIINEYKMKNS
jgi:hypothetical protein